MYHKSPDRSDAKHIILVRRPVVVSSFLVTQVREWLESASTDVHSMNWSHKVDRDEYQTSASFFGVNPFLRKNI